MRSERLQWLVKADGPFASVYFDDSHDTADAASSSKRNGAISANISRVPRRKRGRSSPTLEEAVSTIDRPWAGAAVQ